MVRVSPAILQFGSIPYPGSATQTLTVTNITSGTLTIYPSSNGRSAIITRSTCGPGIASGKSCTVQVEFKPVQLGPDTNTLTLDTGVDTNVYTRVPVRGTATGVGSVSTVLDFGTIRGRGNTSTLPLTITNYGVLGSVTVATDTGATTFKVTSNKVTSNGCTAGITAGNSCNVEVEYAPVQQGSQTAYLKLIPSTGPEQIIVMEGELVP